MLYLQKASAQDGRLVYDMLQGIQSNDNGFHNNAKDIPYDQFTGWLQRSVDISNGIGLEDWMVPGTSYWLFDDDVPVGFGKLRHFLNDNLREDGGHIGYAIAEPHREKGYGNMILRLLLIEAGNMGIKEAHVGTNKDNVKSNKVILRNGGRLIRESETKNYYVIDLNQVR